MKNIKHWIGIILLFSVGLVPAVEAAHSQKILIIGTVDNFDRKTVTLKTKTGIVAVPRSSIRNADLLRPGVSVKADVTVKEFRKLN